MKTPFALFAALIIMASCNSGGDSKQDANAEQGGTSDTGNSTLGSADTSRGSTDTVSGTNRARTYSAKGSDTIGMQAGSSGVVDSSKMKKP